MPLVTMPDGQPVDLPDNPTPEQQASLQRILDEHGAKAGATPPVAQVAQSARQGGGDAGFGVLKPTPRETVQIIGGGLGALPGIATLNPALAGEGILAGTGLGGTAYDVATGSPNTPREALTTLVSAGAQLHPAIRAMSLVPRIASSGLASTIAGSAYDLATGQSAKSVPEQLTRGATDFMAGTGGATLTERPTAGAGGESLRPAPQRRDLMAWGDREGVPLSGADVSRSRLTSSVERFPMTQVLGAQTAQDFRDRQMSSLDAAVQRHLSRIEARTGGGNPTDTGAQIQGDIRRLGQAFDRSADQAYSAERRMLGENNQFMPRHFVETARDIMDTEARSPFAPDSAANRTADVARNTRVTQPATPGRPGVVIQDAAGNDITLGAVAGSPERRDIAPLDWAQGRRYLAQLGEKAYDGNPQPGRVSNASLERLHAALAQDMNEHAASQGPDFVNFRDSIDRMYGDAKDAIRNRLAPIGQTKNGKDAFAAVFQPGAADQTRALRNFLPRETYDQAVGTWLDQKIAESTPPGVGDRPLHSPAQLRAKLKPMIDSGQIDDMFSPDEAQWLRDYYRHSPALGTAEKLAGNPSGTAQNVEFARTGRDWSRLLGPAVTVGTTGAMASGLGAGHETAGALGVAATTALPAVVAKLIYSDAGRRFLANRGVPNPESIRRALYNQTLTHGLAPPAQDRAR